MGGGQRQRQLTPAKLIIYNSVISVALFIQSAYFLNATKLTCLQMRAFTVDDTVSTLLVTKKIQDFSRTVS